MSEQEYTTPVPDEEQVKSAEDSVPAEQLPLTESEVNEAVARFYPEIPLYGETYKPDDGKKDSSAEQTTADRNAVVHGVAPTAQTVADRNAVAHGVAPTAQTVADRNAVVHGVAPTAQTVADRNAVAHGVAPKQESGEKKAPTGQALAPAPRLSDREVMEHTASIWKYQSIVDDGTEQHTESHSKHVLFPGAEVLGARVRGKKHKHEGTNCDDFFETAIAEDCIIAVVSDGAGSKRYSRIGSRVSCESACTFLKNKLTELFAQDVDLKTKLSSDIQSAEFMECCGKIAVLVQQSAREAYEAQVSVLEKIKANENYSAALGREPVLSDLSATFLAAVIVPLEVEGRRECFMATVQIGDGCICAIDSNAPSDSCFKLMGEADSGAFSGETDFIAEKNTRIEAIGAKTRISRGKSNIIMLMSDGVADDYFPAQPMMKRLYLDLCLNGILPMTGELTVGEDPAPIRFKSVSMNQHSVALQYAKQLLSDTTEEAMNALWDKREMLRCHSLEAFRMNIGDTPEERLVEWLDNYNERGSFDDRTLVAVRLFKDE